MNYSSSSSNYNKYIKIPQTFLENIPSLLRIESNDNINNADSSIGTGSFFNVNNININNKINNNDSKILSHSNSSMMCSVNSKYYKNCMEDTSCSSKFYSNYYKNNNSNILNIDEIKSALNSNNESSLKNYNDDYHKNINKKRNYFRQSNINNSSYFYQSNYINNNSSNNFQNNIHNEFTNIFHNYNKQLAKNENNKTNFNNKNVLYYSLKNNNANKAKTGNNNSLFSINDNNILLKKIRNLNNENNRNIINENNKQDTFHKIKSSNSTNNYNTNISYSSSNESEYLCYKCPICANKKFKSKYYLTSHLNRRHIDYYSKISNIKEHSFLNLKNNHEMKIILDKKLDKAKNDISTMINNASSSKNIKCSYINLLEEDIDNKLKIINKENEILHEKQNQIIQKIKEEQKKKENEISESLINLNDKIEGSNKNNLLKIKLFDNKIKKLSFGIRKELSNLKQTKSFNDVKNHFLKQMKKMKFSHKNLNLYSINFNILSKSSPLSDRKVSKSLKIKENDTYNNIDENISLKTESQIICSTEPNCKHQIVQDLKEINKNPYNKRSKKKYSIPNNSLILFKGYNIHELAICHEISLNNKDKNTNFAKKDKINENDQIIIFNKLKQFHFNFKKRDLNYDSKISDYLIQIIPSKKYNPTLTKQIKLENFQNEILKNITKNRIYYSNSIPTLSKKSICNLIKKLYINLGENSVNFDYFGYYSKNIDFLFDLKGLVDSANNSVLSQDNFNMNNDDIFSDIGSKFSFGKFEDYSNINLLTSSSFSFGKNHYSKRNSFNDYNIKKNPNNNNFYNFYKSKI